MYHAKTKASNCYYDVVGVFFFCYKGKTIKIFLYSQFTAHAKYMKYNGLCKIERNRWGYYI